MPLPLRAGSRCWTQETQGFPPALRAVQAAKARREDQMRAVPETSRARMYSRVPSRRMARSDARTNGTVRRLAALRASTRRLLAGRSQERRSSAEKDGA